MGVSSGDILLRKGDKHTQEGIRGYIKNDRQDAGAGRISSDIAGMLAFLLQINWRLWILF